MKFPKISFLAFLFSTLYFFPGRAQNNLDFTAIFNEIGSYPEIITYSNNLKINNRGGHLQGIQRFENQNSEYFFLSGSSDKQSYCAVIKTASENKVIHVNRLFEKPFKHAGGFQIFKNYLAVGIEDNDKKDKSKVCIYDISKPMETLGTPIVIIERTGEPLRNTAGCVGITWFSNKYLIAVGDWDTKHIDFYSGNLDKITGNIPEKIFSIDTEKVSKTGWINNDWNSYQNINLFNINNKLYLIGLGQDAKSENTADLFEVTEDISGGFSLIKVAAKTFNPTNNCNFKAGAGVEFKDGKIEVFACQYNIGKTSAINVFSNKQNLEKQ